MLRQATSVFRRRSLEADRIVAPGGQQQPKNCLSVQIVKLLGVGGTGKVFQGAAPSPRRTALCCQPPNSGSPTSLRWLAGDWATKAESP